MSQNIFYTILKNIFEILLNSANTWVTGVFDYNIIWPKYFKICNVIPEIKGDCKIQSMLKIGINVATNLHIQFQIHEVCK